MFSFCEGRNYNANYTLCEKVPVEMLRIAFGQAFNSRYMSVGTKRWKDLGPDFFPRFLLSMDCSNQKCWYDSYECTPKSFTVKVLRKVRDYCLPKKGTNVNLVRLNSNKNFETLSELWVWEERAVAFCCECGAVKS
ncbi:protein trunk [Bacillus rossius redtenbacheri]|uniref:protein trunk n=1 Tax=Bacillus rossius redtenbacheri TaxID=93214 RepID=UPI002FDDBB6E